MAIRVVKYSRTHRDPLSKQKSTSVKRTASRRNTNVKSKRVATRIK